MATAADRPAPLSFGQETLWFLDQLAPGRSAYNQGTAYRIRGDLDVPALRLALRATVARHEILRTALRNEPEGLTQHVADVQAMEAELELAVRDMTCAGGATASEVLARQRATALVRQPFDLAQPPLWRAELLRLADYDHLLVFVAHSAVFDDWSAQVFAGDLAASYVAGTSSGAARPLLPLQYGDYARWQRGRMTGSRHEDLKSYWRRTLSCAPALDLPADRPRPAEITYDGARRRKVLAAEIAEAARALEQSAGVTPHVVHLAAFFLLLCRYSGQEDLVIGTPIGNRDIAEVENLIGPLLNMHVLRTDLTGDPSFLELLIRVDDVVQDVADHAEMPFELVVDAVQPARDLSRSPLFQVTFAFRDGAIRSLNLPGLTVESEPLYPETSRFDLSWNVSLTVEGLVVEAEFSTDLFDPETIEQLLTHYQQVLLSVSTDPSLTVSGAMLLTAGERHELLTRWNGPKVAVPPVSIPDAFRAQVRATPEAVALVVAGVRLSYAELELRANRLAHLLREQGAAPGERVVLCLNRTADLVIAVLAVLMAGAAYVPVDPDYPPTRMAAILDDAGPVVVVTHATAAGKLPGPGRPVLVMEHIADELSMRPETAPQVEISPGAAAYVLYTSGTTGRPKGVIIEHGSVIAFVEASRRLFGLSETDRILGYASVAFDVSVGEMFNSLLTGARLHMVTEKERFDLPRLQHVLEVDGITLTDLPPSVMAVLEPKPDMALRIVLVGGEAFPGELVNAWNHGRHFFNVYGPTECTCAMIVQDCPGGWNASPPIGLPMDNHVAHVLDENFQLVPYGVAGELVIGGTGLTRGYLNAPELTQAKIVPDPFGTTPDGRLYHTGDIVRRLRDGRLVFVGRIDQQVQIRGLRVELGDVEAALATFPGIEQLAVLARPDSHGNQHLVAYYTSGARPSLPARSIRAHVAELLPGHMVPALYVSLRELPLTVSGKVDQGALPLPAALTRTGPSRESGPRSATERILSEELFPEALHRDRVGIHDDFFELGGNSLRAAWLTERTSLRLAVPLRLADFFRAPTVAALAGVIDRLRSGTRPAATRDVAT